MPLMPCAASPSAIARTSSGCILVKSATWSNVSAVLSTSHTAVAFGISGALLMANLLCASPIREAKPWSSAMPGIMAYISRPGLAAHGVPKSVLAAAQARYVLSLDATCPLVTKVHREAAIHFKRGREILLIGHSHHPEVVGTLGQLPPGAVTLIETAHDAATFMPKNPDNLAFVTQTTLSIDDTAEIVAMLKERFPNISGPHKEDICYATTNRQLAVKKVAPVVDALIVVGAPNSSNSQRLREVAEREGCPISVLAQRAGDIDWKRFEGITSLGITAGASAPEVIVEEIMGAFAERYELHVETVSAAEENEFFPLPRSLRPDAASIP